MIKKTILLSVLAGVMPLAAVAQDDDMYFVQKKEPVVTPQNKSPEGKDYYSGISRGTDDYNRRSRYWSHYQNIGSDSTGNDIVQFVKGMGASPDTVYVDSTFAGKMYDGEASNEDFGYTRRMQRWDGFWDPWYYSYSWGFGPYWRYGWYDPWYYGGWYTSWYDPWYYGWYGPGYAEWYDPWYYGWYPYDYYYRPFYVIHDSPYRSGFNGYSNYTYDNRGLREPRSYGRSNGSGNYGYSVTRSGVGSSSHRDFGTRSYGADRTASTRTYQTPSRSYDTQTYSAPRSSSFGGARSGGFSGGGGGFSGGGFGGGHSGGGGGGHFGHR